MNVLVAGATGVLGRRLTATLTADGHTVYGLVRDDRGARQIESAGGTPCEGDVLEPETLADAVDGLDLDTVVHAATAIPSPDDGADAWKQNDRVRVEGAKNLLAATDEHDIQQVVFPSVVWVARQPDGSRFDETSPRNPTVATESAATVEDLLYSAGQDSGFNVSILRLGFLYAPDAEHTRYFGKKLLTRDLPVIGGGLLGRRDAEFSLLHADDAARALVAAIQTGRDGLWHVVDEESVTVATFLGTFAELLDAPSPRRIPGWLARPMAGKQTVQFMTSPMQTSNSKFKREFDWEPEFPTYREGLDHVVDIWFENGTLRETDANGYDWHGDSETNKSARRTVPVH